MDLANQMVFPTDMPLIVEKDVFLYPFMISPLFLANERSIQAATYAIENGSLVIVVPEKENGFYDAGVIGTIMRKVSLPDKRVKVLFQGISRGVVKSHALYLKSFVMASTDLIRSEPYNKKEVAILIENLKDKMNKLANLTNYFPQDLLGSIDEADPDRSVDLVCSSVKLKKDEAYEIFKQTKPQERLIALIAHIAEQIENAKLQKEIRSKVHSKIDKVNKEYFLKEQLKQIRRELGEDKQVDEEIAAYEEKLRSKEKHMPQDAHKEIKKQIERLSRIHPDSGDASLLQTYVEWALEIPFGSFSKGRLDVGEVEKTLDKDHYSLEKPKRRISEFFAVAQLLALRGVKKTSAKGTILCFVGPPGVGKTSLANSIAKAPKRSLVRVALGGMEDVNELRGHRRTYIGAMPGRIVQGIIDAKVLDPVIVLDEIDKIGRNFRGDPASALLEILDPEQNDSFRDYYLNFNLDLSKVIFIATANDPSKIPPALKDRLEMIELSSYTPLEKFEIAKRYLIPQELAKHGLKRAEVSFTDSAIKEIIDHYTREAGVRSLRRQIAAILRKVVREILQTKTAQKASITPARVKEYLEKSVFEIDEADKKNKLGVVNGLAWTSVGGDVLKVEAITIDGKGAYELTGSLGDVMKESARIALSVVKTLADQGVIKTPAVKDKDGKPLPIYKARDLHIHVPEGAVPKDGPSAGITMATAISSVFSARLVKSALAMTGEITLTGQVLPIGGLKEKLIAAHKAKIKTVLIPKKNYDKDLSDIPQEVLDALKIIPVEHIKDVLKEALV